MPNAAAALEYAHLKRAHDKMGDLLEAMRKGKVSEYDWLALYDAMSWVEQFSDAAHDAVSDCLSELGLDSEGWPTGDDGEALPDDGWGFHHNRAYAFLPKIDGRAAA